MDKEMNLIKSPDLINLNDTDTDAEIQYKSLDATNGDATADTDEPRLSGDSPSASSPASDSPKPPRPGRVHWQTTNSDEHRQLLATEGESSDRHSSDDEVDVWTVSAEQRQYYVQQFTALQPDITALVPGHIAKAFFEKSKLPVTALSKIWNLSDVTRDGCLCLEEFVTAMHLVVLRRNRIEVPDQLPASLVPKIPTGVTAAPRPTEVPQPTAAAPAPAPAPASSQLTSPKGKEWTKFVESPMSNISSPGIKPVNFDFHKSAVEQNPQILHPVAVKGTREEQAGRRPPDDSDAELSDSPEPQPPPPPPPPPPPAALTGRPIVRKALRHSSSGPTGASDAAYSGPTSLPMMAQTAPILPCRLPQPPPPPPPPRPGPGCHARSSSLDLSRVTPQQPPPLVPPRSSPADVSGSRPHPARPAGGRTAGRVRRLQPVPGAGAGADPRQAGCLRGLQEARCRGAESGRQSTRVWRRPACPCRLRGAALAARTTPSPAPSHRQPGPAGQDDAAGDHGSRLVEPGVAAADAAGPARADHHAVSRGGRAEPGAGRDGGGAHRPRAAAGPHAARQRLTGRTAAGTRQLCVPCVTRRAAVEAFPRDGPGGRAARHRSIPACCDGG